MPDHIILCADLCCDWHCSQLIDNDDDFCVDADDDDLDHGSWANMVVIIILITVIIIM